MNVIRIGSRESRLAVIQSEMVIDSIRTYDPALRVELVTMKTTGDKILDRTLDKIGGKGLFVKELDAALLEGRTDFTVHSSKDLPMVINPELPLAAFSRREDPRDVLVLPVGADHIDFSGPIGCSSVRRQLQLKQLFPEARIAPVRGNVLTRLEKLDRGDYSALVLASAGLKRLGLEHRISRYFSTDEILPAAGQAILAVQTRKGVDTSCLSAFHDPDSEVCITAERAFVRTLDGGCSSPVAAYAVIRDGKVVLKGMYVTEKLELYYETVTGELDQADRLGIMLAENMRRKYR